LLKPQLNAENSREAQDWAVGNGREAAISNRLKQQQWPHES